MTERPQDLDPTLEQRDVERAEQLERADVDPEQESNAPNREVRTERVGPGADPADQPGPLDPGQTEPDLVRAPSRTSGLAATATGTTDTED